MARGLDMLAKGMGRLKQDLGEVFAWDGRSYVGVVGSAEIAMSEDVDFGQGQVWLVPVRFHRPDFAALPRPGQSMTSAAHGSCEIVDVTTNQDALTVYLRLRR